MCCLFVLKMNVMEVFWKLFAAVHVKLVYIDNEYMYLCTRIYIYITIYIYMLFCFT